MLLTEKEKELLLAILKKERIKLFQGKEKKESIEAMIHKIEQSMRNVKVNEIPKKFDTFKK
ncbi:hypothetical protein F9B85_07600 [Heliorestis acidaminivorans]|uniref:Uncharacterized protein n=1 Tax=Heliorestis acidaminivorans TaxID=553427 RepID=A0A6I0F231_9FIRM|nr:hypothetical protein [Heliorestis acidaminivorans]KAB2952523.1 hypothetical protein F9B85_07600 [Heliorestis acidaminivorans]